MARTLVNAHQLAPFSGSSAAQIKVGAGSYPGPGSGTGKDASITMESGSIAEMGSIYFNGGGSVAYDSSALQLYGNTNVQGTLACETSLTIGSAAMVEADLEKLDGITNGTGAANKALVLDGSRDVDTINALGIASMANNWTNASRTVADMGIVTTIDINGGSIDGTAIGANSVAAGSFAAVVGTTGTYSGILKTDDNTAATSTTDGSLQTDGGLSVALDAVVGDDLILLSDAAVIHFGASKDVTLTHVADVGLTLTHATGTGDNLPIVLQLKSEEDAVIADEVIASLEFAAGDSDGTDGATVAAGIHAIAEEAFAADANATSLVFTAADSETAAASATPKMTLASTGNLTTAGSVTAVGSFIIGSADMSEADLEKLDGITNGTAAANKALVADANIDIASLRNVTATGAITAGTSFIIGSADMNEADLEKLDGITNGTAAASKAVVLDGSKNIATIGTVGCGAITSTGASTFGSINVGGTITGDTSLTLDTTTISTAELGVLDSVSAGTAAASKAVVLDGSKNIATLGTVGCGAITSTGNSAMAQLTTSGRVIVDDTTAATSTTDGSLQTDGGLSVALDAVVGDDLMLLSDAAVIHFGASKDVTLTHVADVGLTLTHTGTGDNLPVVLQLKSEEDAVIVNEVIASLEFAAGDSDGTDGATVAAGIHAIAEETFAADANATKLVFTAADSETAAASATAKMTLASTGNLTTAGSVTAVGSFIIGSADMSEADLEKLDGITNGTAVASKAVVLDASADTSGMRNLTLSGDITIQDGGSLKETGGTAAFTFDGSGHVTKIGQDSPSNDEVLTWDGSKWVSAAVSALSGLGSTDNVLLRANGTGGNAAQGSGIAVDDSNNMSGIGTVSCGALTSVGDMLVTADTVTFQSSNVDDSLVVIKSTYNGAPGARLKFVKDKGGAGADNDVAGEIQFFADDDAQDQVQFGAIQCLVKDASNGAEGGEMLLSVASHDGELNVGLALTDGSEEDEIDVTIGNGANSVVNIPGNLVVAGTTTTVNTVTMEAANAVVFEGATPDGNETTLSIVDPTGDHTQYLINQGGYIPVLAAATTTAIAATPAEIDAACDASARTAAVVAVADDHFLFCDGAATGATRVESLADLATAQAGDGIAAVSGQFKVDYIIDSCIGSSGAGYTSATGVYTLGATGLSGSEMVFLNGQVLLPGTSLANGDYTYATASVELHPDLKLDGDDVLRVYYLL